MKTEPLLTRASITAAVAALLAVAASFGLDLSSSQTAAITSAAGILGPLALALWARRHVTPVSKDDDPQA